MRNMRHFRELADHISVEYDGLGKELCIYKSCDTVVILAL